MIVSLLCYYISDYIGYRAVALILLFSVSFLAILLSVIPVLIAAILSALIWDFFFIPPHFTFHVERPEDILMLLMYFAIALLNGILTSRIRHYEMKVRSEEEQLKSIKLYSALFDSLSHELRTPIQTILGVTETLIHQGNAKQVRNKEQLYSEILMATNRLNRLVSNLMNISRLESGLIKPKLDWTDINELINSVLGRLNHELQNYFCEARIPSGLPLVMLDVGLMEQALHNVIQNITVHTPEGTRITLKADCLDDLLTISIQDDGPGFIPEFLDTFPASRHDRCEEKKSGLGLGLSIAKGFINAHQGSLTLYNLPVRGAGVDIRIPVASSKLDYLDG